MNCYDFRLVTGDILYKLSTTGAAPPAPEDPDHPSEYELHPPKVTGDMTITASRPAKHILRQCLNKSGGVKFSGVDFDSKNTLMVRKGVYCDRFDIIKWPEYVYDGGVYTGGSWGIDRGMPYPNYLAKTAGYNCTSSIKYSQWYDNKYNDTACIAYSSFNGSGYKQECNARSSNGYSSGIGYGQSMSYPIKPWKENDPYYPKALRNWEKWKSNNMTDYTTDDKGNTTGKPRTTGRQQAFIYIIGTPVPNSYAFPIYQITGGQVYATAVFDWIEDKVVGRVYAGGITGDSYDATKQQYSATGSYVSLEYEYNFSDINYYGNYHLKSCTQRSFTTYQIGTMEIQLKLD